MNQSERNYEGMNPYSIIAEINNERPGGKIYIDDTATSSEQNNPEEEVTETQ
jgi:hypothetical protein